MVFRYREPSHSVPSNDFLIPEYLQISEMALKGFRFEVENRTHSLFVMLCTKADFDLISLLGIFRFLLGTSIEKFR